MAVTTPPPPRAARALRRPVTCTSPAASSKIPGCTGTQRRLLPGPATSTSYPRGDWASSADTGTASAFLALAVVMFTVTGAWSRVPAASGSVSFTCTGIVVAGPCSCCPAVVVATVPTEEIMPGTVVPSGSVTVTLSPALTCDWSEASSGIVTTCRSEVAVSTGPDAGPPRVPVTWLTRSAPGSNTTCPSDKLPGGPTTPRCSSSCCTAYAVSQE